MFVADGCFFTLLSASENRYIFMVTSASRLLMNLYLSRRLLLMDGYAVMAESLGSVGSIECDDA